MAEAENKPAIRIHIDQQVAIATVSGREEVEDATVATEITGFDVEGDSYILKGALSLSGFLRQGDESGELPDAFDDQDVFAVEAAAEAEVIPVHQRLPFVLQVPVAAQQSYQREAGILNVNPKIGQWNLHVLGEKTLHLRCELILQGLSGQEGYVFRCGTQEEGVAATRLDQLLEEETARGFIPPTAQIDDEFVPPFEPAWRAEEGLTGDEEANAQEDDWVIETPTAQIEEDEREVVFTPDPTLNFPLPDAGSDWIKQLQATDRFLGDIATPHNPLNEGYYGQTPASPFEHQQYEEAEEVTPTPWRTEEPVVQFQPPVEVPQPYAVEDPYSQVRQQFQADAYRAQQPEFLPNQPIELQPNAPVSAEFLNQWQQPTSDFNTGWQQPTAQNTYEVQREDDDEDAFIIERDETEHVEAEYFETVRAETPDASHKSVSPVVTQVPQAQAADTDETAEGTLAEYTFEDELPRPTPVIQAVPVHQELDVTTPAAVTGPKISFAGKPREEMEPAVKLSAIFGENGMATREESAPFNRESSSSSHHHHHYAAQDDDETVLVKQFTTDSIWGGMLSSAKESKTTMKFHVVQVEESLPALAERYSTSISDLLRANNMNQQDVETGQLIYIPTVRR